MFFWRKQFRDAPTLLKAGETHQGLMLAVNTKDWALVKFHIGQELELPEINEDSELRGLLIDLVIQLTTLAQNISNPRSPVPALLKASAEQEVNSVFDSLFQTCERLQVVAQQGVKPARLRNELQQEHISLQHLLEATEEANAEMARLILSAGRGKISDASDQFARLGWTARELTRFNHQIEGGD